MSSTRSNEEWLQDLREGGTVQENAIADLVEYVMSLGDGPRTMSDDDKD